MSPGWKTSGAGANRRGTLLAPKYAVVFLFCFVFVFFGGGGLWFPTASASAFLFYLLKKRRPSFKGGGAGRRGGR